jgi:septum formation protein
MLLEQAGIVPSKVDPQDVDESALKREIPRDYVKRVTRLKADSALINHPDAIILSADTIVVMGRRIFQKPESEEEAHSFLTKFSGRRIRIYTTVVVKDKNRTVEKTVITSVSFARIPQEEIEFYLRHANWQRCSGGLVLEKIDPFTKGVNGSYSNMIGLPLYETVKMLKSFGVKRSDAL